jgi:hypothetical protein
MTDTTQISRLLESVVHAGAAGDVFIRPAAHRKYVDIVFSRGYTSRLKPQDAYDIGRALQEMAVDNGYDPDTAKTHDPYTGDVVDEG